MIKKSLKIPNHVGIIVDGNGRWASERGLSRSAGHAKGASNLEKISIYAINLGIKYLSLYVFSTENFKRSKEEVDYLMNLFVNKFKSSSKKYNKENIKVIFSGRKDNLNKDVIDTMKSIEKETKNNTKGVINFCLNYGSQYEIIDAVKKIAKSKIDIDKLDIETFNKYMYNELPPLDLVIRTSGEERLSNFMLWQSAYAEFYFPKTYFPAFGKKDFDLAIEKYNMRDRRFGGIKYEKKSS